MSWNPLNLRGALTVMGTVGRAAHRLRPDKPSPSEVAELFDTVSPAAALTIAGEMSALRYQNQLLVFLARHRGSGILERHVDVRSLEPLKRFASGSPAIFLTWHLGPPFGLLGAFGRLGLDVLAIRRTAGFEVRFTTLAAVDDGSSGRAKAVLRAVKRLRKGGLVIIAGDGVDTAEMLPAPCLGRVAPMPRGPFAIARLSGAPVVPLVARWDDDGWARITVGEQLRGEGSGRMLESSLALAAGRWLESYLLSSPRQLRRCSLRWLLDSPRLEGGARHRLA